MNTGKDRKFLFDHNNFDLPDKEPEPEVYIEPPPIFTLDELGHARDEAFAKGRQAGLEQARLSREQYLASQTDTVLQELRFLIGAEEYRAAVYERETIALTETIFKTLFPHFTEREGLNEIKAVISKVLINQPEQASIVIELPEEDAEQIESYFSNSDIDKTRISFKANPQIARASCRMSWKDGGALREHNAIADEVFRTLKQIYVPVSAPASEENSGTEEEIFEDGTPLANPSEKDQTDSELQGD